MRADEVLVALARRHQRDLFITEVKTGPSHVPAGVLLRLDAVAIARSWAHPTITAYEVKVDRHDYLADSKWDGYLPYCHRFYFAVPKGLVRPEEVPDPAGLVWVDPTTKATRAVKAAVHRPVELPAPLLYYLLIVRTENDRHPFFSERRALLEAWVQDRAEREQLGRQVRSKLLRELEALRRRAEAAEQEAELARRYALAFEQIRGLLNEMGIAVPWVPYDGLGPSVLEGLREALRIGADGRVGILIRQAIQRLVEAERLLRRQEPFQASANPNATLGPEAGG